MRSILIILLALIAGLQLGGCATILNGTTQDVAVSSDPPGAEVTAGGNYMGVTPIVLDLQRKNNHIVTISMDGYHTEQVSVTKVMSGAVAGNILAGGFIGWGIDASSGAQYKLKPDTIAVSLKRRGLGEADVGKAADRSSLTPASVEDRLRQLDTLVQGGMISQAEYNATRQEILVELAAKPSSATQVPLKALETAGTPVPIQRPLPASPRSKDAESSWIYGSTND